MVIADGDAVRSRTFMAHEKRTDPDTLPADIVNSIVFNESGARLNDDAAAGGIIDLAVHHNGCCAGVGTVGKTHRCQSSLPVSSGNGTAQRTG